jgi:DNA invertase Pin-like site-specific DNA recombinase
LSAGTHTDNTRDAIQKKRHHFPPGSGKLTIEDAREIRALYTESGQYAWIARRYKLDKKTVRQIILSEIWRESDTDSDTLTGDENRQLAA